MQPSCWHHTSLAVRDLDPAIRFYGAAFGFEVVFREDGMTREIAAIAGAPGLVCDLAQLRAGRSGHVLELVAFRPATGVLEPAARPFATGCAHVAFLVDDLDRAMREVEGLGAERLGEVTRFDEGLSVYYREPAGSFFEMEMLRQTVPS